jgi:hypothetical protein
MNFLLITLLSLSVPDPNPTEVKETNSTPSPQKSTFRLAPVLSIGGDFGGDTLFRNSQSGQNLDAGKGGLFSGGIILGYSEYAPHIIELQTTIGYKYSRISADGDSISWSRVPLEALLFYRNTDYYFRFGGGISYQFKNSLKTNFQTSDGFQTATTPVADALGYILEADFVLGKSSRGAVGIRYTGIRYHNGEGNVDGHSVGIVGSYAFDIIKI